MTTMIGPKPVALSFSFAVAMIFVLRIFASRLHSVEAFYSGRHGILGVSAGHLWSLRNVWGTCYEGEIYREFDLGKTCRG
jgi:hypothetical protein